MQRRVSAWWFDSERRVADVRSRLKVLLAAFLLTTPCALIAQERTTGVRVTAQGLMLDFQDADLRLVIAALAEAGNLNVVYGELPQKRVTLRTTQPLDRAQIPA